MAILFFVNLQIINLNWEILSLHD